LEDYFGVPLNTTIEVLKDINNDELKFKQKNMRMNQKRTS
jgi:hypothetical protein